MYSIEYTCVQFLFCSFAVDFVDGQHQYLNGDTQCFFRVAQSCSNVVISAKYVFMFTRNVIRAASPIQLNKGLPWVIPLTKNRISRLFNIVRVCLASSEIMDENGSVRLLS